ncbi:MAG: OsmC family protein [Pseudomonadota bacterium]
MKDKEKIKAAFERAIQTVTLRPERGQRTYRNVARLTKGLQCRIEEDKQTLVVDAITALGGDNCGPSPVTLLRSALSSCVAMGIKQWAAKYDADMEEIVVVVETDVDARGQLGVSAEAAMGFEAVRIDVSITSSEPQATIDEVVKLSMTHSPLKEVFNLPIQIDQHFSTHSSSAA